VAAQRPIAPRAFTVLLTVLLVGSLVAPIAASSPAAAQDDGGEWVDGSFEGTCDSKLRFAFPLSCPWASFGEGDINTSQSASQIEVDIHTSAVGVGEGLDQTDSTYQNYLEDTETLASLEARDAIATAYENNKTATEAQAAGQQAINDYYAHHQTQLYERASADAAEFAYYVNISTNDADVSDRMIHGTTGLNTLKSPNESVAVNILPQTQVENVTLVNGSSHSWDAPVVDFVDSGYDTDPFGLTRDNWVSTDSHYHGGAYQFNAGYNPDDFHYSGVVMVENAPAASLDSQDVYDYRRIMQRLDQIDQQADTVQSNYPSSVAEDLYAEMDSGNLSPSEVRGAEGMVRYMSDNATEGDSLELALRHTLDLEQPESMDSSMMIHFDGKTDRVRNASTGNVTYEYTSVNETYEGLLFASGVPGGSLETGTTYNVSDFDGQPTVLPTNGSEVVMWEGQFTVEKIYNSDGNEVENVSYGGPEYKTYNASEFIAALENASEARAEIVVSDGGGGGGGIGDIGDLFGNNPAIGLVVVGAVIALFITGKFSN
jgi:hypothetical protein